MDLGHLRENYETAGLDESELASEPIEQFERWFAQALDAGLYEPNAMTIVSVDAAGWPRSRNVLLKGVDGRGFVFHTNYHSDKGRELAGEPKCALTFSWLGLNRQVRISGLAERLPAGESDAYFASRPRGSQIGAWASPQSESIVDRTTIDALWQQQEAEFADREVPRPPHWGGLLVKPASVEFWQGRRNRLHDRLRYVRSADMASGWQVERLAP